MKRFYCCERCGQNRNLAAPSTRRKFEVCVFCHNRRKGGQFISEMRCFPLHLALVR